MAAFLRATGLSPALSPLPVATESRGRPWPTKGAFPPRRRGRGPVDGAVPWRPSGRGQMPTPGTLLPPPAHPGPWRPFPRLLPHTPVHLHLRTPLLGPLELGGAVRGARPATDHELPLRPGPSRPQQGLPPACRRPPSRERCVASGAGGVLSPPAMNLQQSEKHRSVALSQRCPGL